MKEVIFRFSEAVVQDCNKMPYTKFFNNFHENLSNNSFHMCHNELKFSSCKYQGLGDENNEHTTHATSNGKNSMLCRCHQREILLVTVTWGAAIEQAIVELIILRNFDYIYIYILDLPYKSIIIISVWLFRMKKCACNVFHQINNASMQWLYYQRQVFVRCDLVVVLGNFELFFSGQCT